MSNFLVGDVVRDINPTWARRNEMGTVVSVRGNNVTWRSNTDGELVVDTFNDLELVLLDNNDTQFTFNKPSSTPIRSSNKCVGGYQVQDINGNWKCPNMSDVNRRRNVKKDVIR